LRLVADMAEEDLGASHVLFITLAGTPITAAPSGTSRFTEPSAPSINPLKLTKSQQNLPHLPCLPCREE